MPFSISGYDTISIICFNSFINGPALYVLNASVLAFFSIWPVIVPILVSSTPPVQTRYKMSSKAVITLTICSLWDHLVSQSGECLE